MGEETRVDTQPASERPPWSCNRRVLVLQGGGALGSYQAGVCQALAETGGMVDWVAGVSIGAVNASIVAGNPPERRIARLREFWETVTENTATWPDLPNQIYQAVYRQWAAAAAITFGQTGFFQPRRTTEWFDRTPPTSYYDTSALKATLERLVDFDLINRPGGVRLSVGAVNVETGNMVYFDSDRQRIGPEHVMASGALPPGLGAVEIEGHQYWDGGLVSNTPLQYVMDFEPREDMLVFQIDLFPARGRFPENLDEVAEREKDIRYSSRTRTGTTNARLRQEQRNHVFAFLDRLPAELRDDPVAHHLRELACPKRVDIVHLIYRPPVPQGSSKDFEFSRGTMERRWKQGRNDARATLEAAPWQEPPADHEPVRVFDVLATARR